MTQVLDGLRTLPRRAYAVGFIGGAAAALAIGIPTDVVPNPWFTRMTPVRPLDVVFLVATAILTGALIATYVVPTGPRRLRSIAGTGVMSVLAVGCPVCNKLVVALIGATAALEVFAPLQPVLGGIGVAVAVLALRTRLRILSAPCAAPPLTEPHSA